MNFESENNFNQEQTQPTVSAIDRLKAATQATEQIVEEIPYLPVVVYAIPKKDWEAFRHGLREALTFQPTLYEQIGDLATREELNEVLEANWDAYRSLANIAVKKIGEETEPIWKQMHEIREALEQDGKKRERIICDIELSARRNYKDLTDLARSVRRWIIDALAGSAVLSGLVSLLVSLLLH